MNREVVLCLGKLSWHWPYQSVGVPFRYQNHLKPLNLKQNNNINDETYGYVYPRIGFGSSGDHSTFRPITDIIRLFIGIIR